MSITNFMDNGAKGTKENLFTNVMDNMPDSSFLELYGSLTGVLAKQFVNIPDTPINPLTQAFIGEPLEYGDVIEDIYIDAVSMGATKHNIDELGNADDELGFANVNIRKHYSTINAMNTGKVSRYMHEIQKASLDRNVAGTLGEGIMASLRVGQVACVENQTAKVLVSSIPSRNNVYCGVEEGDSGAQAILKERQKIVEVAMEMSKVNGSYNATGYEGTAARDICIIAPKEKWADLILDKSGVHHPEFLEFEQFEKLGVKITPIAVDKIETPVSTAEASEYQKMSGITWDDAPGKDEARPDFIICDKRYFRINPFINRYQMYAKEVVANVPFTNFFLHMQNALSYQPNRKAVRVYSGVQQTTKNRIEVVSNPRDKILSHTPTLSQQGVKIDMSVEITDANYEFVGYESKEAEFVNPEDIKTSFVMPNRDVYIVANLKPKQNMTEVVFYALNKDKKEEVFRTITVEENTPIIMDDIPSDVEQYKFKGFPDYKSGETIATGERMEFHAEYDIFTKITFYAKNISGGMSVFNQLSVKEGEPVIMEDIPEDVGGYKFKNFGGFVSGKTLAKGLIMDFVAEYDLYTDVRFYAKNKSGETELFRELSVKEGDIIVMEDVPEGYEEYEFMGFEGFTSGETVAEGETMEFNATYSRYTNIVFTAFNQDGKPYIFKELSVLEGSKIVMEDIPESYGEFKFLGFIGFVSGETVAVGSRMNFEPKYEQHATVVFRAVDYEGDLNIFRTRIINIGDTINMTDTPPTYEGFVFERYDGYVSGETVATKEYMEFYPIYQNKSTVYFKATDDIDNPKIWKIMFIETGTPIVMEDKVPIPEHYEFVSYEPEFVSGQTISTDKSITFTANYIGKKAYVIGAVSWAGSGERPSSFGSVDIPKGEYRCGDIVDYISAKAVSPYKFLYWDLSGGTAEDLSQRFLKPKITTEKLTCVAYFGDE